MGRIIRGGIRVEEIVFSLAPTEGITGYVYRSTPAMCHSGVARLYSSFISPGHAGVDITKRDRCDILPESNTGLHLTPQFLANNAKDFLFAVRILWDHDYIRLNLNLGCSSGTVTAKKKGSGFLSEHKVLRWFFECVSGKFPSDMELGVKTRLGVKDPVEFPTISGIYNDFPLFGPTVHPYMQEEFYRETVYLDAFALATDGITMPLGYNDDLIGEADIDRIRERFPSVFHIMLRRGLLRDPTLAARYLKRLRGGEMPCEGEEKRWRRAFHVALLDGYGKSFLYENATSCCVKEVWDYLGLVLPGYGGAVRELEESKTLNEYEVQAEQLFTF